MRIFMENEHFGQVKAIDGMSITIEINKELLDKNLIQEKVKEDVIENEKLYVGTVGDVFVIGGPDTNDSMHYGIFEEIKLISNNEETINKKDDKAVVIAKIIGYQNPNVKKELAFKRGIGHYPRFNSKCYLLTSEEKKILFSVDKEKGIVIGSKGGTNEEEVSINVDKFLSKHSVIFGSTGSGKSCTVASILQKILKRHEYSHIIFFDLHNEYGDAFPSNNGAFKVNKVESNKLGIPYWFLNFEEFQSIFLGDIDYGKNSQGIRILKEEILKLKKISHKQIEGTVGIINNININAPLYFSFDLLVQSLRKLNKKTLWKSDNTDALDENGNYLSNSGSTKVQRPNSEKDYVIQDKNYYDLLNQVIEKLESIKNDKRYQFLFSSYYYISTTLYEYIKKLLCIPYCSINNQITILDLSTVPSEIIPVIIGMISRICFEYKLWEEDPNVLPIYLVFEEAHNYIPRESNGITKLPIKYIGRIAKEGRKYGISQLIISQRPADLNETIVSQCSNFFVLRVTNPNDQSFIQKVLPDQLNTVSNMIPFFENGECLVAGECVPIPIKCIIDAPDPEPNSKDVLFSEAWKKNVENYNVEKTIHRWWDINNE